MHNTTIIMLVFISLLSSMASQANKHTFSGADGIIHHNNKLLIVDSENDGVYTTINIITSTHHTPEITINTKKYRQTLFKQHKSATNLTSIDILADDRIVVLSKNNGTLVGLDNVIAFYPGFTSSFDSIGLQGLATRPTLDSSTKVAILWEGGYPDTDDYYNEFFEQYGRKFLHPRLLLHDVNKGERLLSPELHVITLNTATIVDNNGETHGFRATDLVWHQQDSNNDGIKEWGFIVLLCSESFNQDLPEHERFKFSRLQRFTIEGTPVGHYMDLSAQQNATMPPAHWSGLGWYKEPNQLILTRDKRAPDSSVILFITPPKDWNSIY